MEFVVTEVWSVICENLNTSCPLLKTIMLSKERYLYTYADDVTMTPFTIVNKPFFTNDPNPQSPTAKQVRTRLVTSVASPTAIGNIWVLRLNLGEQELPATCETEQTIMRWDYL